MRLTCPNCGARYEVADSMIPPEGRDVQCSNCSTTWFQPGRRTDSAPRVSVDRSARQAAPAPAPPPAADHPAPEPHAAPAPEPEPTTPEPEAPRTRKDAARAEAETGEDDQIAAALGAAIAASTTPRRREITPEVRDILREEAEREARLRQAEAEPVETQSEMPLSEQPDALHRARRRAELEAAEEAFETDTGMRGQPARDLFPDIDEINSTLRDTGDRSETEADSSDIDTLDAAPRRRRGTRIGFLLALALAAGAVVLHVNSDRIAARVPALAPAVEGYSERVDAARFWLDGMAQRLGDSVGNGS